MLTQIRFAVKDFILLHPWPLYKPKAARKDFIGDIFMPFYYNRLGKRKDTFLETFRHLQSKPDKTYKILETGTARSGMRRIEGDGASSLIFDIFLRYYDGSMVSVDIDPNACAKVSRWLSPKSRVINGDSCAVLSGLKDRYDLVYLDSMDIDWNAPEESAKHHVREFKIIEPFLAENSLLLIDDSPAGPSAIKHISSKTPLPWPTGKGYLTVELVKQNPNFEILRHEYQCLIKKRRD